MTKTPFAKIVIIAMPAAIVAPASRQRLNRSVGGPDDAR